MKGTMRIFTHCRSSAVRAGAFVCRALAGRLECSMTRKLRHIDLRVAGPMLPALALEIEATFAADLTGGVSDEPLIGRLRRSRLCI
jgi:hypothetical protein